MNSQRDTTSPETDKLRVLIALGANLASAAGTPAETLKEVINRLRSWSVGGFAASSLYQSSPENCPAGTPDFVNAVVSLELPNDNEAEQLLDQLMSLEREFGRQRDESVNASRPLDLDLIAFGTQQQLNEKLTLPHPRFHQRRFVLEPLAELDPELVIPPHQATVRQLLQPLLGRQSCTVLVTP